MELDDLKKSWNALDEHLKSKEFRPFLLDNPLTVHPGSLLGFVLRPLPEPDPDR